MNAGGWIIMLVSVGGVTALFLTCLYKVLAGGGKKTEHMHGLDIDTHDVEEG